MYIYRWCNEFVECRKSTTVHLLQVCIAWIDWWLLPLPKTTLHAARGPGVMCDKSLRKGVLKGILTPASASQAVAI